jgi:membrane protein required for beta-lactamase induction
MATIIAMLVAVIADRYAQYVPGGRSIAGLRSSAWLNTYLLKLTNLLDKLGIKQNYLVVLTTFLPLCIALLLLKLLFGLLFGTIGTFLFIVIALLYFLGNRDVEPNLTEFVSVHETSFGVLFWFSILGPTGALLYWFLVVSKQSLVVMEPNHSNLYAALDKLHALAAWIPARITGFLYALVGNFSPGFKAWMVCASNPSKQSSEVLQECGEAAVDTATAGDDVRLVTRAFIAWVVLSILIVVIK